MDAHYEEMVMHELHLQEAEGEIVSTALTKIIQKCELDSKTGGGAENDLLMPIIRELCAIVAEQQKALEIIEDSNHGIDCDLIADGVSRIALGSTTKRRNRLADSEGK